MEGMTYATLSFDPTKGTPKSFLQYIDDARDALKAVPTRPLEQVLEATFVQVGPVRVAVVTITPAKAWELLIKHNLRNRKISYVHAAKLGAEIAAGRWTLTHQGGAFNKKGDIEDMQHRLLAVAFANKPITMMVVLDLEDDLFKKIDSGKIRSIGSSLELSGHNGLSTVVGHTVRELAIPYDEGTINFFDQHIRSVAAPETIDYISDHPTLLQAAHDVFEYHATAIEILSDKKVAIFTYWRIREDWGQEVADDFMEILADDGLPDKHPISLLQRRIDKHKLAKLVGKMDSTRKNRLKVQQIAWLTAAAFRAVRKSQRTLTRLDPRADDDFPRFEASVTPEAVAA